MNLDLLTLSTGATFITHEGNLIRNEAEGEPEVYYSRCPDTENSPKPHGVGPWLQTLWFRSGSVEQQDQK